MIKTYKVKLKPNNKQRTQLFRFAICGRYAYNWAIEREEKNHTLGYRFITEEELRKEFTQLKKRPEYNYFNKVSNNVMKKSIKEACASYYNYLYYGKSYPRLKTSDNSPYSFYQDPYKIKFTETHVKIEKLTDSKKESRQNFNWIRLAEKERIPLNVKYYNPRFKYDGLDWYITVGVKVDAVRKMNYNEGIGIDLGVTKLAVCSDGYEYENINKSDKVLYIERRIKRLQKSLENKMEINKKGDTYCKTKNIAKLKRKIRKNMLHIIHKREDYLHKVTSEIVARSPEFICIEDLGISRMMKNEKLSKPIQKQNFKRFRRHIIYKANLVNIKVIIADQNYPSSKRCIKCGRIKTDLTLSDRIYVCVCGNVIDRDYQASMNLKLYGERAMRGIYSY